VSIDVSLALIPVAFDAQLVARCLRDLPDEERSYALTIRHDIRRMHFIVGRALCRERLEARCGMLASSFRFELGLHGRPELVECALSDVRRLNFNLTSTTGLIACVVGEGCELGIDAEHRDRKLDALSIARHFFADCEVEDLQRLEGEQRRERFFTYWTLKEAYLKARGTGLSIPPHDVVFRLDETKATIGLELGSATRDRSDGWYVFGFGGREPMFRGGNERAVVGEIPQQHRLAIAVRGGVEGVEIRTHRFI
jgi:4'-phosphopantetheinyl transferase